MAHKTEGVSLHYGATAQLFIPPEGSTQQHRLMVMTCATDGEDGACYTPAQSVEVWNKGSIEKLRDFLILNYPVVKEEA